MGVPTEAVASKNDGYSDVNVSERKANAGSVYDQAN
jgi:hypothetical protein